MYRKGDLTLEFVARTILIIAFVAVIIAFLLLKVSGLSENLFGFLGERYGKVGTIEGKALHVKIDPEKDFVELFEFHLTEIEEKNPQHVSESGLSVFYLDSSSELFNPNCIILTTYEMGFGDIDLGYIYYVSPGTIIQKDKECTSLATCIKNPVGSGCKYANSKFSGERVPEGKKQCLCFNRNTGKDEFHECPHEFGYVVDINFDLFHVAVIPAECPPYTDETSCDSEQTVLNAPFRDFEHTKTTKECYNNPSVCNLLLTQKTEKPEKSHAYEVKYGLICDADGKWKACTEEKVGIKAGSNEQPLVCQESEEPGIFVWKPPTEEEG